MMTMNVEVGNTDFREKYDCNDDVILNVQYVKLQTPYFKVPSLLMSVVSLYFPFNGRLISNYVNLE